MREEKYNIYKGLKVLIEVGRKQKSEWGTLDLSKIKKSDVDYVLSLFDYLWETGDKLQAVCLDKESTFESLLAELKSKDFSDDIAQFSYKVEHCGEYTVYVLVFRDKYSKKHDRVDVITVKKEYKPFE